VVLRGNADPVIADEEDRFSVGIDTLFADLDRWPGMRSHECGSVADRVLHDLNQPGVIAKDV
jgi:hypothetical protein